VNDLRRVRYVREEYQESQKYEGSLLTFLYDVPYFPPCGIFPPLRLLNQFLSTGGSNGGMSPGATWEPFCVSEQEYVDLVESLRKTPLAEIEPHARYAWVKPSFDPSLDSIDVYWAWMAAACQKHRDRWRATLTALGPLS
jgi:hypothetical protein